MSQATANPAALFYADGFAARLLRQGLRLAQGLGPRYGGALALRLFSTPLPPKWAGRRALPAPWRGEDWQFDGRSLRRWRHAESDGTRPRVLLVHGWGGRSAQMLALAEALWREGYDPVLLDWPAHGHSGGWTSNLPQWRRALFAVVAELGPLHAIVAHSLGAVAALSAAARGLPVQRLALLATSAPPATVLGWFSNAFGLGDATRQELRRRLERLSDGPLEQFEPGWLASRLHLPVLLIHDEQDRAAPFELAGRLAQALPQARLISSQGLGHRRVLDHMSHLEAVCGHLRG
ncbi:alpha/beta fold hydrolase [Pelomonas sp. SE-A7]|uniref:alpha/beta hydrolase n=1 Tax=Pelomonas sp. SE-A7 TaxID=3054953 RepID=UPI00259C89BF|nr:alpha/beta fold hydrolase [Pelomonas sp. SE-A7]MDM4767149.1 alpha/beta fold hydrolase [Pelomonas sp. SE-A7]